MNFTGRQKVEVQGVFRLLSFVSLGLIFAVIIVGAFVSARGQGLSCSDWPLCPTGFSLSPGGEHFIEYVHRIIALIGAISVYVTTICAIKRFVKARTAATFTSIAVSFQIAIGMLVVLSELQPLIVAVHTGVGVLTLALALITFILSYPVITGHPDSN
ncbi:MAG: COX15/CtaA family protein [Nitrososphaeraceae archaeon]